MDRLAASHSRATAYAAVPSPGGQYILVNKPPLHLTFELQGKSPLRSVKTGTNNLIFEVDAQIFQLMAVPVSTIRQRLTPTRAGVDEHLLRAHFQGEKQHFQRTLGKKLGAYTQLFRNQSGRLCLYWEVHMPQSSDPHASLKTIGVSTVLSIHLTRVSNAAAFSLGAPWMGP